MSASLADSRRVNKTRDFDLANCGREPVWEIRFGNYVVTKLVEVVVAERQRLALVVRTGLQPIG